MADPADTTAQGSPSVTVTVDRVGGTQGKITVEYATANGTAAAGTDFSATSGSLRWASGDGTPKTFDVPLLAEAPFSGTLQLSAGTYSVDQSAGSVAITVSRVGGASGSISVSYATINGTAVAGTDYAATTGVLNWADGDTSTKMFTVPILSVTPFSGTKTFTVALNTPSTGAAISSPGAATVTITGAGGGTPGSMDLSASSYSVSQSTGTVSIAVDRTGGSSGATSVDYATVNGTALAGTDYTATSGTLQWADGDGSTKTISVPISNSSPLSQTKAFTMALSDPTDGANLGTPSSATVSITSNATDWVYYNGVFYWPGDWSFAGTPNYSDTAGSPLEGSYDIAFTVTSPWGGWQPYAPGLSLDTTPYKYLIFSLKPTQPNQVWNVAFESQGDTKDGVVLLNIAAYGPTAGPVVGQWGSYKIPLSAFQLTDPTILKFAIQDNTGLPSNLFYVDNVGFTSN